MSHPDRLIDLVTQVITAARGFTPRETVELGFVHGLCLDAANAHHPDLVEILATARGLAAVGGVFFPRPGVGTSDEPLGCVWSFFW